MTRAGRAGPLELGVEMRKLTPLAPFLPMSRVQDGQKATVLGRVACDAPLISPVSALPSVCFELSLWCRSPEGRGPAAVDFESCPFSIVDAETLGRVECVDPLVWIARPEHVRVVSFEVSPSASSAPAPPAALALAAKFDIDIQGVCWLKETSLPVGSCVAAWGRYCVERRGGNYRSEPTRVFHLESPLHGRAWVTDDSRHALETLGVLAAG